jgi:glutamine---fructose-6-phosphate transaminase (isomerizing)
MCGIFAYLGPKENAGDLIFTGLKLLEYRGYDSWGIALKLINNNIYIERHTGKIGNAKLPKLKSHIGIGHTRWATHGGVTENNAHPHTDCNNKVIVVHNGIIENFSELKEPLLKSGHKFKSETDTEVFAHFLEEKLKKQVAGKRLFLYSFNKLKGLNAIITFFPEEEAFYAIKNGSPLVFGYNAKSKEYFLASDSTAIAPYTNQIYFLEDNELLTVDHNGFHLFDIDGVEKKPNFLNIKYQPENWLLGKYPHYMIKEINEQPKVIENIINNEKHQIQILSKIIEKACGAYFIGCGTAYYAGLAGTYLFSKIAKRHINTSVASEFSYLIDFLKDTSLIIALSQSGETIDIISPLRKVKEKQAKILAITNVLGSSLYRMADYKMLLNAGPEKCVLATKSFTAKIAIIYLLAYSLNGGYDSGVADLKKAIEEIKIIIKSTKIKNLIHKLKNKQHIYVLGRGVSYPTALESALKIKEVSYIHAEGFAAGELKHGVIALIEKGTPVIVFNPEDETYEDTLASAYEVKARGAYLIGISSKKNIIYDEFIPVTNCHDATIIPNVVVAQLIGYYLALAKGLDPDKPRNLAKSVTVK